MFTGACIAKFVCPNNVTTGVIFSYKGIGPAALRTMLNGAINHGSQFLDPGKARVASTYYGPESGAALAIRFPHTNSRRVGVIGLGAGTLAAYGERGDTYRFYELNPAVIALASLYAGAKILKSDERGRGIGVLICLSSLGLGVLGLSHHSSHGMIALLGGFSILVAVAVMFKAFLDKYLHQVPVAGWTSLIVVLSFFSGVILFSLSVIAEYIGLTLNMAMGRPTYLVVYHPPRPRKRTP